MKLGPDGKCQLSNPATGYLVGFTSFGDLLRLIIQAALYFAGTIAVILLIIGGYRYVAARGNEEAMEKAKKTLTAALIGIVLIILAFAIVNIVDQLLKRGG